MINSLYIAQSGLSTSRYSVDVTSNNIANENSEGYVKRVVNTSEINYTNSNQIGSGVSFDGVTRTTSDYLYDKLISQNSLASYYEQEDSILSELEIIFSETDDSGFSTRLSDFFDSLESLRSDSTNLIYQNEVSTQALAIVNDLNRLNNSINETIENTIEQLENQVDSVNNILGQIAYLNEEIFKNGNSSNDLLDKRDFLEKELSNYVNIDVSEENGMYSLKIGDVSVIFNNTNLSELSIDTDFINLDNLDTTLKIYNESLNLTSGSLKALSQELTTSTSNISFYKQSLDDFVTALVTYTTNNSNVPLFSGTDIESLTFEENNLFLLTSDDLENLAQMQWNQNITIGTISDTSFSEFYQNLLVTISSNVENNNFKLESQNIIVNSLETTYDELTKVDSDEEMINLLQYQAAYEANAKVITVVDEMLQTLLNM